MVTYFKWIFDLTMKVHADSIENESAAQAATAFSRTTEELLPAIAKSKTESLSWYVIPVPEVLPKIPVYNPMYLEKYGTLELIGSEMEKIIHYTPNISADKTGHEGWYGLFQHMQLPDIELGLDIDVASFSAGAIGCIIMGLYVDNIYNPRRILTWWPTRSLHNFIDEGMYVRRSLKWMFNLLVITFKIIIRGLYGGVSHWGSRIIYFTLRNKMCGKVDYIPLIDETFPAWISGCWWTSTLNYKHSMYDRIIFTGWSGILTGMIEYVLYQYFLENQQPGLYRWFFGGAFYGPGVWRYLTVDKMST